MGSKYKLFNFCGDQARNLKLKKPAKGSGSNLAIASGDNEVGGEVDNGVLEVDLPEKVKKMDEDDEQEQGDVEEGGTVNDVDHCVKYRISIR